MKNVEKSIFELTILKLSPTKQKIQKGKVVFDINRNTIKSNKFIEYIFYYLTKQLSINNDNFGKLWKCI